MTATDILEKFPDIKLNMTRDFLGKEMRKLGFVSKSYGINIRGNAKLYCIELVK
jgi:hypothetical protein